MSSYYAIRELPGKGPFSRGDYLVLFGELFSRGYANGLLNMAKHRGLTVVRTTVGRREKDNSLRPLNAEELGAIEKPVINVPLEAGFDLEAVDGLDAFINCLKDVRSSEWENFELNEGLMEKAIQQGRERLTKHVRKFVAELEQIVPKDKNVYFAHLMAGGVPRARAVLAPMNRVFKGVGERFCPSEKFWNSGLGRIVARNFLEVSAESYGILLRETASFREARKSKVIAYSGFGYHGTEVLLKDRYTWQSYAPYLQGWAKLRLEEISKEWHKMGVRTTVYNCPEILTQSSSIFQGVELPLYPLLRALKRESPDSPRTEAMWNHCQRLLKPGKALYELMDLCEAAILSPEVRSQSVFENWPQHNSPKQMERLLSTSDAIFEAHLDLKNLVTFPLSEIVFSACGRLMMNDVGSTSSPVSWINHDIVAKCFAEMQ
ncbi:MAG: hypothetical protein C5B49_12180 [Bdellovibrio sp.]|nr:MAG: hypothetical protein C5B49_12180 [Bdellovibrio sp.]